MKEPPNNAMNLTKSTQTAVGPRRSIQCSADIRASSNYYGGSQ